MRHKITATPTLARCVLCSAEVPQDEYGDHARIHRAAPVMLEALESALTELIGGRSQCMTCGLIDEQHDRDASCGEVEAAIVLARGIGARLDVTA